MILLSTKEVIARPFTSQSELHEHHGLITKILIIIVYTCINFLVKVRKLKYSKW